MAYQEKNLPQVFKRLGKANTNNRSYQNPRTQYSNPRNEDYINIVRNNSRKTYPDYNKIIDLQNKDASLTYFSPQQENDQNNNFSFLRNQDKRPVISFVRDAVPPPPPPPYHYIDTMTATSPTLYHATPFIPSNEPIYHSSSPIVSSPTNSDRSIDSNSRDQLAKSIQIIARHPDENHHDSNRKVKVDVISRKRIRDTDMDDVKRRMHHRHASPPKRPSRKRSLSPSQSSDEELAPFIRMKPDYYIPDYNKRPLPPPFRRQQRLNRTTSVERKSTMIEQKSASAERNCSINHRIITKPLTPTPTISTPKLSIITKPTATTTTKPVTTTKPTIATKPVIATKPIVATKPVIVTKPTSTTIKSPTIVKSPTTTKPVTATKSTTATINSTAATTKPTVATINPTTTTTTTEPIVASTNPTTTTIKSSFTESNDLQLKPSQIDKNNNVIIKKEQDGSHSPNVLKHEVVETTKQQNVSIATTTVNTLPSFKNPKDVKPQLDIDEREDVVMDIVVPTSTISEDHVHKPPQENENDSNTRHAPNSSIFIPSTRVQQNPHTTQKSIGAPSTTITHPPKARRRPGVPAPWKIRMDEYGEFEYYNTVTGEITQTRPE